MKKIFEKIKNLFTSNLKDDNKKTKVVYKSFKEEMELSIIPWVEIMIQKESDHLNFFKENDAQQEWIFKSKINLTHLRRRLKQYKKYINAV